MHCGVGFMLCIQLIFFWGGGGGGQIQIGLAYSSYKSLHIAGRIDKQMKINRIRCRKERVRKVDHLATVDHTRLRKHDRGYTVDEKNA